MFVRTLWWFWILFTVAWVIGAAVHYNESASQHGGIVGVIRPTQVSSVLVPDGCFRTVTRDARGACMHIVGMSETRRETLALEVSDRQLEAALVTAGPPVVLLSLVMLLNYLLSQFARPMAAYTIYRRPD